MERSRRGSLRPGEVAAGEIRPLAAIAAQPIVMGAQDIQQHAANCGIWPPVRRRRSRLFDQIDVGRQVGGEQFEAQLALGIGLVLGQDLAAQGGQALALLDAVDEDLGRVPDRRPEAGLDPDVVS